MTCGGSPSDRHEHARKRFHPLPYETHLVSEQTTAKIPFIPLNSLELTDVIGNEREANRPRLAGNSKS